jgi:hypothetical protein
MHEYLKEASYSYINGNFRSCIFSCSAAIDQIFRHEIIRESKDYEGTLNQISNLTLGPIIGMARNEKIENLKPIRGEADWINRARKKIAVHPICITAEELDDKLSNKLKVDFINNVLELADEETKEKILSISVKYPNEKRITLLEVLKNPYSTRASDLLMWDHHNMIIEHIALDVYKRTVRILLHLFPTE